MDHRIWIDEAQPRTTANYIIPEYLDEASSCITKIDFGTGRKINIMEYKWITQDGRILLIKDMDTNHIKNCINMLDKQIKELENKDYNFMIDHKQNYINVFKEHLKIRNILL